MSLKRDNCGGQQITSNQMGTLAAIKGVNDKGCVKYENAADLVARLVNTATGNESQNITGALAGNTSIDLNEGNVIHLQMPNGATNIQVTHIPTNRVITLFIKQPSGGGADATFSDTFEFVNGESPLLSENGNAIDLFQFFADGMKLWVLGIVYGFAG